MECLTRLTFGPPPNYRLSKTWTSAITKMLTGQTDRQTDRGGTCTGVVGQSGGNGLPAELDVLDKCHSLLRANNRTLTMNEIWFINKSLLIALGRAVSHSIDR